MSPHLLSNCRFERPNAMFNVRSSLSLRYHFSRHPNAVPLPNPRCNADMPICCGIAVRRYIVDCRRITVLRRYTVESYKKVCVYVCVCE